MFNMFPASGRTIAIPPGETIREQLKNRKMQQKEFAVRMGLSEKHISHLLSGKVELTQNVALRLEAVLGVPANYWNNLESIYREKLARVIYEVELEKDAELALQFPYAKMARLGWVAVTRNKIDKALNLRKFFEVATLNTLEKLHVPGIAYRAMGSSDSSDYCLAAWAQKARLEARRYDTAPINIANLEQLIPEIRGMTIQSPDDFSEKLIKTFAKCGIALVFLPHIGGSFLHGATFNDGAHIVMGLTVRGKDADKFWFSLFHEICHIVKGHINVGCYHNEAWEEEADNYARDILISHEAFQSFIDIGCFTKKCIESFAKDIGIAPGIVVGRMQKENYIPYNRHNELKEKYQIL